MNIHRTTAAVVVSTIALALVLVGPARAADPLGTWLTGDKKAKVKIVNCGGAICGSLSWLAEPNDPETHLPKTDKNNKDAAKQSRPLLGVPIVLSSTPFSAASRFGLGTLATTSSGPLKPSPKPCASSS